MKMPYLVAAVPNKKSQRAESDRGVYLPLLAIMITVVLVFIVTIGVDSSSLKHANADLRLRLEEICKSVSYSPMLYSEGMITFRNNIQALLGRGGLPRQLSDRARLYRAKLIMPTMPSDGNFATISGAKRAGEEPFGSVPGITRCDLDPDANGVSGDCIFDGSTSTTTDYPATLFDPLLNAGNTVACEAYATVDTFVSGRKEIVARTAWWRPVRRKPNTQNDAGTGLSIAVATELLTKAHDPRFRFSVAHDDGKNGAVVGAEYFPHPFTGVINQYYDPGGLPPSLILHSSGMAERYDPLWNFYAADPPPLGWNQGRHGFSRAPSTSSANPRTWLGPNGSLFDMSGLEALSSLYQGGDSAHPSQTEVTGNPWTRFVRYPLPPDRYVDYENCTTEDPDAETPNDTCLVLSDREEMLAACMNPAILVRNAFLATILELASRHGELRSNTEILHVNPQHRNVASLPGGEGSISSAHTNHPAVMVPFGADIARRQFQLPYVSYHSGDLIDSTTGDVVPELAPHKNGWINSFTNTTYNSDPNWLYHHALIAGQLRYCYHLYQGYNGSYAAMGSEAGLNRYSDRLLMHNGDFEPDIYAWSSPAAGVYKVAHSYPNGAVANGESWDQANPWTVPAPDHTNLSTAPENRRLNAAELVSILGSTQNCPYLQHHPAHDPAVFQNIPGTPLREDGVCQTGNVAPATTSTFDLRPDLLGTLRYLARDNNFGAINEPGIFPLAAADPPTNGLAFDLSAYSPASTTNTHILLVTHQRLRPTERDAISAIITAVDSPFEGRPITVVYFPTTADDASAIALDDFKCAFNIPGPSFVNNTASALNCANGLVIDTLVNQEDVKANALFVFSPYLRKYDGGTTEHDMETDADLRTANVQTEANAFRVYWLFLLGGLNTIAFDPMNPAFEDSQVITQAAKNIFLRRILKTELKF